MSSLVICCDWGTTALRVSLCDSDTGNVLHVLRSPLGVLACNQQFLSSGQSPQHRKSYFIDILKNTIEQFPETWGSLSKIPVVVSGMASAAIGMEPLPYAELPFSVEGSNAVVKKWNEEDREWVLISGLKAELDIIRGEETQLVGAVKKFPHSSENSLLIFPGTHSKHVWVKSGKAVSFKTYMTGEVFCFMFSNSILAASVQENDMSDPKLHAAFRKGVRLGAEENIMHVMFRVRANGLFNKGTKEENFALLSGMLIGSELKELFGIETDSIVVCGSQDMRMAYEEALRELNLLNDKVFHSIAAEEATALGQIGIYKWSGLINFDL
ncbi:MAG: hypothetical protein RL131_957 [Bacteroidota bacterium]